jgi:biopolymer transport protein ExbD
MRRISKRNQLVTLSDINITPLLDLAFVLLIIFIIISPSIRSAHEQGMELNLPKGGALDREYNLKDIRTIDVSPKGEYMLDGRLLPLDQIERQLVQEHRANPRLLIFIRVDAQGLNEHTFAVIDRCQRNGIYQFSFRTSPVGR